MTPLRRFALLAILTITGFLIAARLVVGLMVSADLGPVMGCGP